MSHGPILTIIIPTYSRAAHLKNILNAISAELSVGESEAADQIKIIIGNNASTDHTAAVVEEFLCKCPQALVLHHENNVGAEENFCLCIEQVDTPYFWLIGDDDMPKKGAIRRVVGVLNSCKPDLLYVQSEWVEDIQFEQHFLPCADSPPKRRTQIEFTRHVNVWVTYISGMVVNLQRLRASDECADIRRHKGSSLVQLGWILPLIRTGSRFFTIDDPCVIATAGNTGGYSLVQVFSQNLETIANNQFGYKSSLAKVIANYNGWFFLPSLFWRFRFQTLGKFEAGDLLQSFEHRKALISYWLLIRPILTLPRVPAQCVLVGARIARLLMIAWKVSSAYCNYIIHRVENLHGHVMGTIHKAVCRIRGLLMRPFFRECRGPLHIGSACNITGKGNIVFLGPFTANHRNRIEAIERYGANCYSPSIVFGANVSMEDDCHIGAVNLVEIHDNVMLASKVYISDHSHGLTTRQDMQNPPRLRSVVSKGPVILEANVWVGEGASVLPGVRIGRGSIIGANAVVTSDIPPYSVAVGCPAKVIKQVE